MLFVILLKDHLLPPNFKLLAIPYIFYDRYVHMFSYQTDPYIQSCLLHEKGIESTYLASMLLCYLSSGMESCNAIQTNTKHLIVCYSNHDPPNGDTITMCIMHVIKAYVRELIGGIVIICGHQTDTIWVSQLLHLNMQVIGQFAGDWQVPNYLSVTN